MAGVAPGLAPMSLRRSRARLNGGRTQDKSLMLSLSRAVDSTFTWDQPEQDLGGQERRVP